MKPANFLRRSRSARRGFTLLEVMLAMGILMVIISVIYSVWHVVVHSAKAGSAAAASAQRERAAMRILQEAVSGAQLYAGNPRYYSFEVGDDSSTNLSFIARLPEAFPRSGKFGASEMRRVLFSVEAGPDRTKQLVLRQQPVLAEDLDEDEKFHPVVLAENIKAFTVEVWDATANDWAEKWAYTNQLPKMVRMSLQLAPTSTANTRAVAPPVMTTVVAIPSLGVQATWQPTVLGGGGNGGNNRNNNNRNNNNQRSGGGN